MTTTAAKRFLAAVPALPVSDERAAVRFFEEALGFVELEHDGCGLGILRRDQVEVHVWVADGSTPGAERHLAGSASCGLQVTGPDAADDAEHAKDALPLHRAWRPRHAGP